MHVHASAQTHTIFISAVLCTLLFTLFLIPAPPFPVAPPRELIVCSVRLLLSVLKQSILSIPPPHPLPPPQREPPLRRDSPINGLLHVNMSPGCVITHPHHYQCNRSLHARALLPSSQLTLFADMHIYSLHHPSAAAAPAS